MSFVGVIDVGKEIHDTVRYIVEGEHWYVDPKKHFIVSAMLSRGCGVVDNAILYPFVDVDGDMW